jgi:hypothetical protein
MPEQPGKRTFRGLFLCEEFRLSGIMLDRPHLVEHLMHLTTELFLRGGTHRRMLERPDLQDERIIA